MLKTATLFIFLIASVFCQDDEDIRKFYKREHSLVVPYQGVGLMIPNWDFFGSTIVTDNFIRLTPDEQSKRGGIFNNNPITFRNWEVLIHFKIDGHNKKLYGDGMAFWYVQNRLRSGSAFGHEDIFNGLGIFLDTYANQNGEHNHAHPYISAMVNNNTEHYDHDRDGTHTQISGCQANIRGVEHDTVILIRYLNDVLTVKIDVDNQKTFKDCFKVEGVILPTGYYIGLTAATGDLSDNHYVMSIRTSELDAPNASNEQRDNVFPSAKYAAAPRLHVDDPVKPMSNFKFFMLILCAIIGLILVIAVSISLFNKKQEINKKRFY